MKLIKLSRAVQAISEAEDTSMSIWVNYWAARKELREFALQQYQKVTESYIREGKDLTFPSEGFKEIADDMHMQMRMFDETEENL